MNPLRLGILGSGKGSNFEAILDAIYAEELDAEIAVVLSDVEDSGILQKAMSKRIRAVYLDPGDYRTRLDPEVEEQMVRILQEENVNLVVLAGFMRILKEPMLEAFPRRIINIHPSLLPDYPGLEAWKQALEAGEKITGCTVHYVDAGIDTGEIIAQGEVDIFDDDTPETLLDRIQRAEHVVLPMVLKAFTDGTLP